MALKRKLFLVLLFFFLSFFLATQLFAQLSADFSIDKPTGCSPLAVQFTNSSTGSPDSYQWDLGNGNKPTIADPATIYIDPGTYNVTLTVSKAGQTANKTHTVTVFKSPVADFVASVSKGCLPLDVYFTDHTVPGSGALKTWFWDFGDGTNASVQNPVHKYTQAGKYTVALIVTDNNGCNNTLSRSSFIVIDPPSLTSLAFSGKPLSGCDLPLNVAFSNSSTGKGLSYLWNFGDGQTAAVANPVHAYTMAGLFQVFLVGTNAAGCSDTLKKPAYVNILNAPFADFNASKTLACAYEGINFTNTSSPEFTKFHWDFGDGDTANQVNPVHQYSTAGTFAVSLKADFGNNCTRTVSKNAFITIKPSGANFIANPTAGCSVPFTVNFSDQTPSSNSWNWDFGDGRVAAVQNPVHTYLTKRRYTVSLSTTRAGSTCTETVKKINYINVDVRKPGFKADKRKGCFPLSVAFTDTSVSNSPIVSWNWDFGDGSSSTLQNPVHVFNAEQKFDITLIVTNSLGCTDTLKRPGYIKAGFPPTSVNFTADKLIACASQSIQFTDLSQHANGWFWDFGKGKVDSSQNPLELFRDTGKFDVSLTADFNGCPLVLKKVDYIYISPPVALFSTHSSCKKPYLYTMTEYSIGANSWTWDYGDGSPVSNQHFDTLHTYAARGVYRIKLLVSNAMGCIDSMSNAVNIIDPKAGFTALNTSGCPPLAVNFTDASINARRWRWNFGDGTISTLQNPAHTYTDSGKYTVSLRVDSAGCKDSITIKGNVNIGKITADFKIDTAYGCLPLTVQLSNKSVPVTGINSYFWTFGDGTTYSGIKPPPHVYTVGANYNISLTIKTATCRDSALKQKFIQFPPKPSPDFLIGDTLTCKGSIISFLVKNQVPGYSYLWNFGDGTSDFTAAPNHAYNADGTYVISLKVTNNNGCDSSLNKKVVIKNPVADFSATPRFKSCPNLLAIFTDQSSPNATSWNWSFGDGTGSILRNPSHVYTKTDSNTVQLSITTRLGCTATVSKANYIVISGPKGDFFFSPFKGCPPLTVSFLSKAQNISKYQWDFGDGAPLGNGPSIQHDYNKAGNFHPRLILTDSSGKCTIPFQSPDSIAVKLLAINAGGNKYICRFDSVTIGLSGEGDAFSWTPAAGLSNPAIAMPRASPAQSTTYVMQTSKGKCSSKDSVRVFVNPAFPTAKFSYSKTCLNDTTVFVNASSMSGGGKIKQFTWNFGDGFKAYSKDTLHRYQSVKSYNVRLTAVSDSGCRDSVSQVLKVFSLPVPAFTTANKCLMDSVQFRDVSFDSSGIKTRAWNLGDGIGNATSPAFAYQYKDTGLYIASLNVISNVGCKASQKRPLYINIPPQANFTSAHGACLKVPVSFRDSSRLAKGKIVKWFWNFGDGTISRAKDTLKPYTILGAFDVGHTVISDSGCSNTLVKAGWLKTSPIPKADFSIRPDNKALLLNNNFSFVNLSKDAFSPLWQFGDGESSQLNNPSHRYADTGTYVVSLTVSGSNACPDTKQETLKVLPDFAFYICNSFTPNGDGINDTFNGKGVGIVVYKMELFDRWGNKIFETDSLQKSWDGRAAGGKDIAQMDIYIYKITLRDVFLETHYYSGHFSLIK
jgi:gliding motility-associated-like protein